jgi:signal transduction histidine kinase
MAFRHAISAFATKRNGPLFATVALVTQPTPHAHASNEQSARYASALETLLVEFGAGWVQKKPWILGAHKSVMLLILLFAAYEPMRIGAVFGLCVITLVIDLIERKRISPEPGADIRIAISTAFGMAISGVIGGVTGGLTSPFLPATIAAVVIPAAAFGRRPATYWLFGELVVLMLVLALLPESLSGPMLSRVPFAIAMTFSFIFAAWVSVTNLVALTDVYANAAVMASRMRDEALALHDARAHSLESVGAKVAHEIKNPLSAIGGLVQLLQRGNHDAKTMERLGVIGGEVTRIEHVVRDYLAFSRPLDVVEPVASSIGSIVDDVRALLDARAEKRGVVLVAEGEATAEVDPQRFKEALVNVVDNAIEASPKGAKITIVVRVVESFVSLDVVDQGEGMSADVLARVGVPYFTTKTDGTGLGVVLARAVIAQHGGTLLLESKKGEGTRVSMRWPERQPMQTEGAR